MKKRGILNSVIASEVSLLGHTDLFMIADCGLSIPNNVKRIDIALSPGTPSFEDVYNLLKGEVFIEKQYLAQEIQTDNVDLNEVIQGNFDTEYLTHDELKNLSSKCKFIIRTGECTPYANVILQCGVNFKELNEYSSE